MPLPPVLIYVDQRSQRSQLQLAAPLDWLMRCGAPEPKSEYSAEYSVEEGGGERSAASVDLLDAILALSTLRALFICR